MLFPTFEQFITEQLFNRNKSVLTTADGKSTMTFRINKPLNPKSGDQQFGQFTVKLDTKNPANFTKDYLELINQIPAYKDYIANKDDSWFMMTSTKKEKESPTNIVAKYTYTATRKVQMKEDNINGIPAGTQLYKKETPFQVDSTEASQWLANKAGGAAPTGKTETPKTVTTSDASATASATTNSKQPTENTLELFAKTLQDGDANKARKMFFDLATKTNKLTPELKDKFNSAFAFGNHKVLKAEYTNLLGGPATTAAAPTTGVIVKTGSKGPEVKELQALIAKALKQEPAAVFPKYGIDGAFGGETKAALSKLNLNTDNLTQTDINKIKELAGNPSKEELALVINKNAPKKAASTNKTSTQTKTASSDVSTVPIT